MKWVIMAVAVCVAACYATSDFYTRIMYPDSSPGQAGRIICYSRQEGSTTWDSTGTESYNGSGYVHWSAVDDKEYTFLGDAWMNATIRYSDWSTPTLGGGTTHYIDLVIKHMTRPPLPN